MQRQQTAAAKSACFWIKILYFHLLAKHYLATRSRHPNTMLCTMNRPKRSVNGSHAPTSIFWRIMENNSRILSISSQYSTFNTRHSCGTPLFSLTVHKERHLRVSSAPPFPLCFRNVGHAFVTLLHVNIESITRAVGAHDTQLDCFASTSEWQMHPLSKHSE